MKVIYKATKQDINMPVDIEWQNKIIRNLWLIFPITFWLIMFVNFIFYLLIGRTG